MSEENADSVVEEVVETEVESSDVDISEMSDQIGTELFGKKEDSSEPVADEPEVPEDSEVDAKADEEPEEEPEQEEVPLREAPKSWKKEMRELYAKADPALQEYIETREQQMAEGLEKDRGDANLGRTMRDVMTPYQALFDERGLEAPQAVKNLLDAHHRLTNGTPAQRQAYIQQLANAYGVGAPQEGSDPELTSLYERLNMLEERTKASHERTLQETRERIESEVSAFASEHPYFDEVSEIMANLINAGYEMEDAYEIAVKAHPDISAKLEQEKIEKAIEEREAKKKKEAEKAHKGKSVNVRGRNTKTAPTAPLGSMEDTMKQVLRDIESRGA